MRERVAENLNRALADLLARDPGMYLVGEDVLDPYGGAFKITKGLSTKHPDRVLGMPLSEGAIVGLAGGLALAGDRAVVEIMFSDFVTLAFDQIVNFASKSVGMYGRRVPMPLVVRLPTGGRRGYGPTHSQSLQKHFVGVPHLSLYEVSPFRDNAEVFAEMFALGEPCLLFEDKVLYTTRMYADGVVDGLFRYDLLPGGTARVFVDPDEVDAVVIAPGGLADRAIGAARSLLLDEELSCQVLVPSRLYPLDLEPLLPVLARAGRICVVEDGTAGGTWGSDLAQRIHTRLWGELTQPVRLVHARDSVVPTAAHLESAVLVGEQDIHDAVREVGVRA